MRAGSSRRDAVTALAAALLGLCSPGTAFAAGALFGVVPWLGREELVLRYAPLCRALEARLGPVMLRSAPDYRAFLARLESAAFDLALAPPHFVRRAARRGGYVPIWQLSCSPAVVLVTLPECGIDRPEALAGRQLLLPDPLSLVALLGQRFLEARGLAGKVRIRYASRFPHLLEQLQHGLVDAVFLPRTFVDGSGEASRLEVVGSIPAPVPLGPVFLAHPCSPAAVTALEELAATIGADPEAWSALFPGPPHRPLTPDPRDLAVAASLLDSALAGSPT